MLFTFTLDTSTSTDLMSGAKSQELINEWCQITKVGAPETNQPTTDLCTNQPTKQAECCLSVSCMSSLSFYLSTVDCVPNPRF